MKLPNGEKQLTTYEEVRAAWGDLFTIPPDNEDEEGIVYFANNPRVAIVADAVYVHLRKPVNAGPEVELTDVLRIREPIVADIRLTDKYKGEVEKAIAMICALTNMPKADANEMAAGDFRLIGEVLNAFLP